MLATNATMYSSQAASPQGIVLKGFGTRPEELFRCLVEPPALRRLSSFTWHIPDPFKKLDPARGLTASGNTSVTSQGHGYWAVPTQECSLNRMHCLTEGALIFL